MDKIKFTRDGWRGVIAHDFTISNISKVAFALARWINTKSAEASVVIGYDSRFGGEMFMEAFAKIIASKGIRVYIPENFVSSAMVSMAVHRLEAACGIIITGSDSPSQYSGVKLKGSQGGPMLSKDLKDIENLITEYEFDLDLLNWNYLVEKGQIQYINLLALYHKYLKDVIDISVLENSEKSLAFDAMYGSTQNVFRKLLPKVHLLNCEENPTFRGITPVPLQKNLHELEEYVSTNLIDYAIAVDGDGESFSMYDERHRYLDSNHLFVLMVYYMAEYKKQKGLVVTTFATTNRLELVCEKYGLELERTPIGYSNIAERKDDREVILGGDETGSISLFSFRENDSVLSALQFLVWVIEDKQSIAELFDEVEQITGTFYQEQLEIKLNRNERNKVLDKCASGVVTHFKGEKILQTDQMDGFKFQMQNNKWVLIRTSSWYPVLKIYAEANTREESLRLLQSVQTTIKLLIP